MKCSTFLTKRTILDDINIRFFIIALRLKNFDLKLKNFM